MTVPGTYASAETPAPVDPLAGTGAKFVSLQAAIDAIPKDHTHAILFDGVVVQADRGRHQDDGTLEKLGGGWSLAGIADYSGAHGALGEVELGKSW